MNDIQPNWNNNTSEENCVYVTWFKGVSTRKLLSTNIVIGSCDSSVMDR